MKQLYRICDKFEKMRKQETVCLANRPLIESGLDPYPTRLDRSDN